MRQPANRSSTPWLWLLGALIALPGCYKSHPCGDSESCDFADNDCDRRIDEDFLNEDGIYATLEHCGGCNVACPEVFPTAAETACEVSDDGLARCVLVACPDGWHRAGDGACAPDVPVLCAPCAVDADCTTRDPQSVCVSLTPDGGAERCLLRCDAGCPNGFSCEAGVCTPDTGSCACTAETVGTEFACRVERDDDYQCAGAQVCTEDGLGECTAVLEEACNGADDDCDRGIDEDFRDEDGRYISRLHCGACANPCVEPGPNMVASCLPDGAGSRCEIECVEGFVDVDGIAANGCECERFDGSGPPPAAGGDADCDGVVDITDDFIYVATHGSDTNPGTLEEPMRTLPAALARAQAEDKSVLVARGIYGGFDLVAGVSVFGGYRPDFRDRDLSLFPVVFEQQGGRAGQPVITCQGVRTATRLDGFTVEADDATQPGRGSTAMYLNDCGEAVHFSNITVQAGRGADGINGENSSDVYEGLGGASLAELDGMDGGDGAPALDGICRRVTAGNGGRQLCRMSSDDISGGGGGDADCPFNGCVNGAPCGNAGCTDFTVGGVCDIDAARAAAAANPSASPGRGPAGGAAGDDTYNAPTNRGLCNFCDDNPTLPRTGVRGRDGLSGVAGRGGLGCDMVVRFDTTNGELRGGDGTNGQAGSDGSGGGGGSPGSGYAVIGGTAGGCEDRSGGAGGGGGSGGCGAPEGRHGTGGGGSLGIAIRLGGASVGPTLEAVRIVTGSAGDGGDGGVGAAGGAPGSGGNGGGTFFWCSRTGGRGGDGGRGGSGGGGGGGCGGSAHGIFVRGAASPAYMDMLREQTIERVGVSGDAGRGGSSPGNPGTDGLRGGGDAILMF